VTDAADTQEGLRDPRWVLVDPTLPSPEIAEAFARARAAGQIPAFDPTPRPRRARCPHCGAPLPEETDDHG